MDGFATGIDKDAGLARVGRRSTGHEYFTTETAACASINRWPMTIGIEPTSLRQRRLIMN
jgi:hypothetical protein